MQSYYWLVGGPTEDAQGHKYYGIDRHFAWEETRRWEDIPAWEVMKDYQEADWEMPAEWEDFFPSLDIAKQFQSRFRAYGYSFNIIAIYPCESAADVAAVESLPGYLGLDVASTEPQSILHPLVIWRTEKYDIDHEPFWALVIAYARLRINEWGLLPLYEDAALLRDVMRALEKLDATHQTPEGVRVRAVQEIRD